jgi:low affinity Fe/Cu permease
MRKKTSKGITHSWEDAAQTVTEWSGKPWVFGVAVLIVILWAIAGPVFGFSNTWQLVINTGTTIITFLMVFLIQQTQNKDTQAIELKLNEIVAAIAGASNRLIDVESLTSADLAVLRKHYQKLAVLAQKDSAITQSHSIDEAEARHKSKQAR